MGNCIFKSKSEAKGGEKSGSKGKSNNTKHSSSDFAQKRDFFEKKGTASIKRKSPKTAEELWGKGKTTIAKEMATEEISKSNKTIGDEGITVDFRFIKVHTSN